MKWEIKDVYREDVVEEGSGYDANTEYDLKLCIPKDSCHSFTIYNYWTYPYYLKVNNVLVATGNEIWDKGETTEFACVTESPSLSPTRTPCDSDELEVIIVLDTDGDGDQTNWDIVHNGSNDVVKSGDNYNKNEAYEIAHCLSNKIEYTFTIYYNWSNDYQLKVSEKNIFSVVKVSF